jgi:hypothetical protein
MTMAKRILIVALIVVGTAQLFGCGVGVTPAENRRAAARVVDYDARMMVDDVTLFTQLDRPIRNSRWVID